MLRVFFKRAGSSVAALFISLSAHAMNQQGQFQQEQQCGRDFNLTMPKVASSEISCRQTKNQVLYELQGGTTINKKETTVHECLLVQALTDNDDLLEEYPIEKVCPDNIYDQSQICQQGKGKQCGPLTTKVLKKSKRIDFDGVKKGNLTITQYTEEELVFRGGDAHLENRTCQNITTDQFLSHFTGHQASNFSINEVKQNVDSLITELKKGPLMIENNKDNKFKVAKK